MATGDAFDVARLVCKCSEYPRKLVQWVVYSGEIACMFMADQPENILMSFFD